MELLEDIIADISEAQVRYFGGPGKMILPSIATVSALIAKIPEGKLITTVQLRRELANQFNVQGACPVTTKKALKAISRVEDTDIPYWRVVKTNGELLSWFPGGAEEQAERLADEGINIQIKGNGIFVADYAGTEPHSYR